MVVVEEDEVELCAVQVEAVESPVVVVYFPAMQSVHRVVPALDAYLPAPQEPESALYLPAGHDAPMRLTIVWRWCSYLDLRATADERTDLGV